jgi:hypothetical protein
MRSKWALSRHSLHLHPDREIKNTVDGGYADKVLFRCDCTNVRIEVSACISKEAWL